jgi:hypothetical protein
MIKIVNVDTLFRSNYLTTPSTNFPYVLPESIRNVVAMRLASIEIPNMINMFSVKNKSNVFTVRLFNVTGAADTELTMTIPDGSYMADAMVVTMNNVLQTQGAKFIIFEILSNSKVAFRARNTGEGVSPYDATSLLYSPNFRFEIDFGVEGKLLSSSAGWNLGFRTDKYIAVDSVTNLATGITYRKYVESESSYGSAVDNYLFLEVDDFHNNFQTDTVVSSNAASYIGQNVLARIVLNGGFFTIVQNNGNDGCFKKREYLGPVRVERLHFRLINKFGDVVDLTHNDFSFALEFTTIYS